MPPSLVAAYYILRVNGSHHTLGDYPRGIPFFCIYKKEKGDLIIWIPKDRWDHQTIFKAFKFMSPVLPQNYTGVATVE